MTAIKDNLKSLRIARGLSQNEAAEALNVTRQTISSYETGRTEPDLDTIKKLAELYQADIRDVLYGGNQMQRKVRILFWGILGICIVFLLGLLLHSALNLINNIFYDIADGTVITYQIAPFAQRRITLWNTAYSISRIGTAIFSAGLLIFLYPMIKYRKTYSLRKLLAWAAGFVIATLAVTVPFMLCDHVGSHTLYLFPILYPLPSVLLVILVFGVVLIIDHVRKKNNYRQ